MNNMMMDPNQDRSNDMMPTQAPFMRYVSSAPVRRNYQPPVNAEPLKKLKEVPADNPGLAKLPEKVRNKFGFQRKNKFCGGMSKPYKKNPLKRTVGVGNKSIKERIQEYGKKQKEENSSPKPSISKKMRPIPVGYTISSNIKKKPALPRKTKYKKARDLAYAKTPRRRKMKAENQRLRRAAIKKGKNLKGLDYDHNTKSFISVKKNRSGHGKGTKKYNTK